MTEPPALTIDRQAAVDRTELDGGAWVDVVRGFVHNADDVFAEFHQRTPWRETEVLRYDRYVPEKRLSAGLTADAHPLLRHTQLHLESRYRVRFSGVAGLLYRNGDDFQGLHSDREMRWLDDTLIAIVVLGERRPFVLRQRQGDASFVDKTPAGTRVGDIDVQPGHGDLLVMGGSSQRTWLHGVPAADTPLPRISLTWRWTSRTGRPDTNPGYADARQFSDRPRQPGTRFRQ